MAALREVRRPFGLETTLDDAIAAATDQMLPLRRRHLGHVEAERILRDATVALQHAIAYARRGLPPPERQER